MHDRLPNHPEIEFASLGSGSSGNCSLVRSEGTAILVDAGISCRQIEQRLEAIGQDPDELHAILLTHEHGDHINGLRVFCKKHPKVLLHASAGTQRIVAEKVLDVGQVVSWRVVPTQGTFEVGGFEVTTFRIPHDAVDPLGFLIRSGATSLGFLTDLGTITEEIRSRMNGVHGVFVEANYDMAMLEADPKRPWGLKRRIMSQHGHLSNDQAAAFAVELAEHGLREMICGHLSSDCNCPETATQTIRKHLDLCCDPNRPGVRLTISQQTEPTPIRAVRAPGEGPAIEPLLPMFTEDVVRTQSELFGA